MEPYVACYQPARLSVLGSSADPIDAHLIRLSGHDLRIVVDQPVAVNAAISLQSLDWLALGEVSYCRPECSHYAIGLLLDQLVNSSNAPSYLASR
jgi:hypothetical protein